VRPSRTRCGTDFTIVCELWVISDLINPSCITNLWQSFVLGHWQLALPLTHARPWRHIQIPLHFQDTDAATSLHFKFSINCSPIYFLLGTTEPFQYSVSQQTLHTSPKWPGYIFHQGLQATQVGMTTCDTHYQNSNCTQCRYKPGSTCIGGLCVQTTLCDLNFLLRTGDHLIRMDPLPFCMLALKDDKYLKVVYF
jgi:hypothetical protein